MLKQRANLLQGKEWLKNSFSIWRNLTRDTDVKKHPASFPVSLTSKILDCFATSNSSVVLDPFAGSGSTLIAGLERGMQVYGFDLNQSYKNLFLTRLDERKIISTDWHYFIEDSRNIKKYLAPSSVDI